MIKYEIAVDGTITITYEKSLELSSYVHHPK